jgi:hypothetical protein
LGDKAIQNRLGDSHEMAAEQALMLGPGGKLLEIHVGDTLAAVRACWGCRQVDFGKLCHLRPFANCQE